MTAALNFVLLALLQLAARASPAPQSGSGWSVSAGGFGVGSSSSSSSSHNRCGGSCYIPIAFGVFFLFALCFACGRAASRRRQRTNAQTVVVQPPTVAAPSFQQTPQAAAAPPPPPPTMAMYPPVMNNNTGNYNNSAMGDGANGLRVTAEGSLSQNVNVASGDEFAMAEQFCRSNPPQLLDFSQEIITLMESPASWRFYSTIPQTAVSPDGCEVNFLPGCQGGSVFATLPVPMAPTDTAWEEQAGSSALPPTSTAPLPADVCYFELTVLDAAPTVALAVGLSSQPYPPRRMPGWHYFSVGYHSDDGRLFVNDPNDGVAYGKPWRRDDVIGVAVIRSTKQVFYTRNGVRLPVIANCRLPSPQRITVYPAIGADGPALVSVNFGTRPFRWAEANERGWRYALDELPKYLTLAA